MEINWEVDAPTRSGQPGAVPAHRRIAIPLDRVLDFARHDSDSRSSRHLAFALRPLLTMALATTGLYRGLRPTHPAFAGGGAGGEAPGGDPELLFSALSSLVEVVKNLTPSAGRVYAHMGHESLDGAEPAAAGESDGPAESDDATGAGNGAGVGAALAPGGDDAGEAGERRRIGVEGRGRQRVAAATAGARSEVVIELVSTVGSPDEGLEPEPAVYDDAGAMGFELAVVAAIVESKGGELQLGAAGGDSRSFVVRLPVCRT
jgi:hypothetical protein